MGVNCSGCACAGKDSEFHSEVEFNLLNSNKRQAQELSMELQECIFKSPENIIKIQAF